MIEPDTIKLLRECDSGVKMGVSSIDEVMEYVKREEFREYLNRCRDEHEELQREIQDLLDEYHDDGREPNPMAKGMSWMKTNVKLAVDESDQTIADLITWTCYNRTKLRETQQNQGFALI